MMKTADSEGRCDLSYREYNALRALMGVKNAFHTQGGELEKRIKTIPNAYRDFKMVFKVLDKLIANLLKTVPTNRLIILQKELQHTYCELKVATPMSRVNDGAVYVPEDALANLVQDTISWKCMGCDRTHKDAKRHCQLYKDIQACYHYEFEKCETCPFSDTEV